MTKRMTGKLLLPLLGLGIFLAGWVSGQKTANLEQTTVHAVAWTAAEGASAAQMEDFKQATRQLLVTMPGLKRAWVGELRRPLVVGDITRTHGLVLEFDTMEKRMAYSDHPARVPWAEAWSKVRVPRSTNFDVSGQ